MIFFNSAVMDTEGTHTQDSDYAQSPWLDMGGFSPSQQSPALDYHGFGYGMLPLESTYGVSVPPPYASLPLTLPSNTWPSMMATHPFPEGSVLPLPIPPAVSPVPHNLPPPPPPPPPRKSSTSNSTPRRTLTDDDRRRMCLYHEENKTAKQTDIGAIFGVERSTVSKVLRQKDKYLNPDDGARSPIKRAKGRVPDIEKALSNWVRNFQRHGYGLSDEIIREKALFFANTCGSPDGKEKVLNTAWLEKFKYKNNLMGVKSRKSSFSTKSDSESPTRLSINSAIASAFQSPSILSPISPTGFATPSPLSPTQSQENFRPDNLSDLLGDYQSTHTKSTISIDTTSSISAGVTSPSSTLLTDSPFTPASQSRNSSTDSNLNRPRSQTFPFMGVDPSVMSPDGHPDQLSPKTGLQQATLQESPLMDDPDPKAIPNLDTSFSTIKRNRSNSEIKAKSIYPPLFPKSATTSPVSSPVSPTQDEARRALELVLNYFEHQPTGLGAQDYMYIGKLMERLELAQTQHTQQTALPGGLHRIDEHDDGPNLHKKRSIRSLG